jgi:hypothetical protein
MYMYFYAMDKQLQALDIPVLWIRPYRLVCLGYATQVQVGIPVLRIHDWR